MPCHTRMKLLLRGLLWLFILEYGFMVTSLEPGFLDFDNLPDTNFSCVGKVIGGYYADLETSCQMFHVCTIGQLDEPMDIRFLCLNGTVFDQETRVCERIDEVDCSKSEQFYSLNLELYGNTQPPILEESSETEQPELQTPKKLTTTTTTTTSRPTVSKTPRPSYIITTSKPTTTTLASRSPQPQVQIPQPPKPPQPQPQLHFGSRPSTDIRFNPEEYKISLSSGGPPSVRTNVNVNSNSANTNNGKPISFQTFSDNNKRVIVTTHTTVYKSEKQPLHVVTSANTPAPPTKADDIKLEDYDSELSDSTEDSYSYGYHSQQHQPETLKLSAYQSQTEALPKTYQFRPGFRPSQVLDDSYKPNTYRSVFHPATNNPLKVNYNHRGSSGSGGNGGPTTYRNHYGYFNQGPLKQEKRGPVLPTIPPLTFSSPAPFSLSRHVETKRFIDHRAQQQQQQQLQLQQQQHQQHQQRLQQQQQQQSQQASQQQLVHHHQPPRIVISASASVSDATGRKFNYSLGTIGDTRFFGQAPQSYDDYKEDDVGSDPFYHDVPKIRLKRQVGQPGTQRDTLPSVEEAGEKEAIDVLKFLFNWYNNHEKTPQGSQNSPVKSETITEINDALTPQQDHQSNPQRDYLYEDFDVEPKQQYAGVPQRNEFERPYLSLQLLKPPFESPSIEKQIVTSKDPVVITEKPITTSTTTTTTTTTAPLPHQNYYDYVDDNYEPLTYQEELRRQQAKEAKIQQSQALVDYQHFKESFVQNYPQDKQNNNINIKESDQNYSPPEYVDDNYEPVVYQQGIKEGPTTPDTLTTLKVPFVDNGNHVRENYYYDRYNQVPTTTTATTTSSSTTTTTLKPFVDVYPDYDSYKVVQDKEYPIYSRNQYDFVDKTSTTSTPSTTTSTTTENYQQVLGILGITTRKPQVNQVHHRGKTRFSLKDVADVPDDSVFVRKPLSTTTTTTTTATTSTSTTTTTETPVTFPKTIETTTQHFQYTINENRRTQEMETDDIDDGVVQTTETMLPTVTTERSTAPQQEIDFAKLGESTEAETIPITEYTTENVEKLEDITKNTVGVASITTATVPTTLIENLEVAAITGTPSTLIPESSSSSTSEIPEMETDVTTESISTTPGITTVVTTTSTTTPTTTTLTSTTTTPSPTPYTYPSRNSSKFNSRRRSKSRYRPISSTATTTTTTTDLPSTSTSTSSSATSIIEVIPLNTTDFPSSPSYSTSTIPTTQRKPTLNEEIIGAIKHKMASHDSHDPHKIEFNINAYTANLAYRIKTTPLTLLPSDDNPKRKRP
ncbi:mucin-4-like [Atheta coriaria]|uniref:mucin-4-like n=1 Tax=Dalotia coriaria TaxID=877792 RepID=UPI0031F44AD0